MSLEIHAQTKETLLDSSAISQEVTFFTMSMFINPRFSKLTGVSVTFSRLRVKRKFDRIYQTPAPSTNYKKYVISIS